VLLAGWTGPDILMSIRARAINPRLGIYFSIFASAFVSLVLLMLIFEQLGVSDPILRGLMFGGPLLLYTTIGLAARAEEPADFFVSDRRVPAAYNGLVLAIATVGGTGLMAITGLFFIHGFDAWCVVTGFTAGLVVMTVLFAPYLRKFGAYTVPSYLGRRFASRPLRVTSAALLAVPMLLVIAAELRAGLFAATWLTGWPEVATASVIVTAVVFATVLGGMASSSWASTAQAIAALIALLVPVALVAATNTNLPLPQLSYGPVLRAIGRLEAAQRVPIELASPLAFDLAGLIPAPLAQRLAMPFGSVGAVSYVLASLTLMAGVAAAPWLLPRIGTSSGVHDARKSLAWATLVLGIVMVTLSAVAVFLRDFVMDTLVGHSMSQLPAWFKTLAHLDFAAIDGRYPRLPLGSFAFKRDVALFALPIAAGYPNVVFYLALAGAIAAAMAASSVAIVAFGNMLAEDVINGLRWEPAPNRMRLAIARAGLLSAALIGGLFALLVPADPLDLMFWAAALSGSSLFPVLVLSIWWRRLNAFGALVGMGAGFAVAVLAILAGEMAWLRIDSALAGVFGIPVGFAGALGASWLRPAPGRHLLELVRDMRIPGGEAVHDREARLLRLKQRQRP
jgi:cation/acetate symporter